jgi:hypothetical protein
MQAKGTTVNIAPPMRSGRRPKRSDDQPTSGRRISAAMLNDAIEIPTPVSSAPSASLANCGATGRTIPAATKKARVAAASATKAGVISFSGPDIETHDRRR